LAVKNFELNANIETHSQFTTTTIYVQLIRVFVEAQGHKRGNAVADSGLSNPPDLPNAAQADKYAPDPKQEISICPTQTLRLL
jgi:hypothetical protein